MNGASDKPSTAGRKKRLSAFACAVGAALCFGQSAHAADLVSRDTFSGLIDLRAAAASGEASWLDGGFGKLRSGAAGDGLRGRLALADAALVWRPRLTWDLSAVVDGEVQRGQGYGADLIQAYLAWKPVPHGSTRYSARAGLFYPPISQEHGGPEWSVTDTITPSAIDTWVGEEVKVVGLEATVSQAFGDQTLTATGAVFSYNDTSGTLLTFRGWALDDIKGGATGGFDLPPLQRSMLIGQPPETYPLREIDNRPGWYARLEWRPTGRASLNAFRYDHRGDLVGVDGELQWAWATRFWNFGASYALDDRTRLRAQLMTGETLMGFPNGRSVWFNVGYTSAYLMLTHDRGRGGVSGRIDYFKTSDRNYRAAIDPRSADWGETGWALTGAYHVALASKAKLFLEVLHVESSRPSRLQARVAPRQVQTQLQSSLRLSF